MHGYIYEELFLDVYTSLTHSFGGSADPWRVPSRFVRVGESFVWTSRIALREKEKTRVHETLLLTVNDGHFEPDSHEFWGGFARRLMWGDFQTISRG